MPGNYSKLVTVITGQTITASERNNEFDNVINNMTPDGVDDASANLAAMQATTDPSGGSLATDMRGEIKRLRFQIKVLGGLTNWYDTPTSTLDTVNKGLMLTTPDGAHTYRIAIDNSGVLTTEQVT